jgi:hypothetical protein
MKLLCKVFGHRVHLQQFTNLSGYFFVHAKCERKKCDWWWQSPNGYLVFGAQKDKP